MFGSEIYDLPFEGEDVRVTETLASLYSPDGHSSRADAVD